MTDKSTKPAVDPARDGSEDPIARAERLGQGDVVNPNVATGQTKEQLNDEIVSHNSNEQLRIAADKRRTSEDMASGRADERGYTTR